MSRRTFAVRLVPRCSAPAPSPAVLARHDGLRTVTPSPSGPVRTGGEPGAGVAAADGVAHRAGAGPGRRPARRQGTGTTFAVGTRLLNLAAARAGRCRPPSGTRRPGPPAGPGREPRHRQPGRFPVVLFSHGLTAQPDATTRPMLTRWARAGFVVAAPAYPFTSTGVPKFNPLDVINQPADASAVLTGRAGAERQGGGPAAGPHRHRSGSPRPGTPPAASPRSACSRSSRDDRLDAGIVLAGRRVLAAPFSGAPAPMLFVHGKRDRTVTYADGLAAFRAVPWSRAMLSDHRGRAPDPATGTSRRWPAPRTEFLRWSLYGDPAAKRRRLETATRPATVSGRRCRRTAPSVVVDDDLAEHLTGVQPGERVRDRREPVRRVDHRPDSALGAEVQQGRPVVRRAHRRCRGSPAAWRRPGAGRPWPGGRTVAPQTTIRAPGAAHFIECSKRGLTHRLDHHVDPLGQACPGFDGGGAQRGDPVALARRRGWSRRPACRARTASTTAAVATPPPAPCTSTDSASSTRPGPVSIR